MNQRYGWLWSLRTIARAAWLIPAVVVLLVGGCSFAAQPEEELRRQVQDLKTEMAVIKELDPRPRKPREVVAAHESGKRLAPAHSQPFEFFQKIAVYQRLCRGHRDFLA